MIDADRLTKAYGGRVAVSDVSFHVEKGEVLGFLGPNGAGKTTTMRMITGFLPATSGTARIAGFDIAKQPLEAKARIGYLCETPPIYREMVVKSYLRFVAEIKRTPRARRKALVDRAIDLCGLGEVAHRVVGHLSKGFRQRVGLAQAILHEPAVLILDEPTAGLDPRQVVEMRRVIGRFASEQTVILSTHILPEVTMMCSRVLVIHGGKVVAEDSIENLTSGLGRSETVRVRVAREDAGLEARLGIVPGVLQVQREGGLFYQVRGEGGDGFRERLSAAVVASGAGLVELVRERATLEEVFLELVTEEKESAAA
jgi:gliding motility-associated transport system ATP-binding protein